MASSEGGSPNPRLEEDSTNVLWESDLDNRFTSHPASDSQVAKYKVMRRHAREFARAVAEFGINSRELSLAITHIEEALFWANASIARHS